MDLWDSKMSKTPVIRVPKGEKGWVWKNAHRNNGQDFPNLARERDLQIQEVKLLPNPKRITHHEQSSGN